jgi:hypothetical protein
LLFFGEGSFQYHPDDTAAFGLLLIAIDWCCIEGRSRNQFSKHLAKVKVNLTIILLRIWLLFDQDYSIVKIS